MIAYQTKHTLFDSHFIMPLVLSLVVILFPRMTVVSVFLVAILGIVLYHRDRKPLIFEKCQLFILAAISLFFVWAAIVSTISDIPLDAGGRIAKVAAIVIFGLIALYLQNRYIRTSTRMVLGMAFGIGFGSFLLCLGMVFSWVTGENYFGNFDDDPLTPFNSNAVVLALLIWPVFFALWKHSKVGSAILLSFALIVLSVSSSLAALVAFFLTISVVFVRSALGAYAGRAIIVVVVLGVLLAPHIIRHLEAQSLVGEIFNSSVESLPSSLTHRLAMWTFASDLIEENSIFGLGAGASRHIPQEHLKIADDVELMPLHPHNMSLQARLELGIPGTIILSVIVGMVLWCLNGKARDGQPVGLALAMAISWLFVANVSYGIWQSWWVASIFLIAIVYNACVAPIDTEKEKLIS